jgi:hypothetical protein
MTYAGRIRNGVAVLEPAVTLPDGTRVRIEVEPEASAFWNGNSVEELAREQDIQPIKNLAGLAINWPEDESIDDFLTLVREARH